MTAGPATSAIVRFLADCYRADRRLGGVHHLFERRIEHRRFFEGTEALLSGEIDSLPLDEAEYDQIAKAAALHQRERSLLYFAFPVISRYRKSDQEGVICAPLLLWSATLERREDQLELSWLKIAAGEQQANLLPLGNLLGGEAEASETLETLLSDLPRPPFGPDAIFDIARLLSLALPEVDTSGLLAFPRLESEEAIREAVRQVKKGAPARCVPACGLVLVENSLDTRGISHELSLLGSETWNRYSPPLKALLGPHESSPVEAGVPRSRPWLPTVLSESQQRALRSATGNPLTLVIGPPGTGKSYTVAAVALERLCQGETVLLSARSPQALDVLVDKMEAILGTSAPALRIGNKSRTRDVASRIESLLQGQPIIRGAKGSDRDPAGLEKTLFNLDKRLDEIERKLARRAELEIKWGRVEAGEKRRGIPGLFQSVGQSFVSSRIGRLPDHWRLLEEYERAIEERSRAVVRLLQASLADRIDRALENHRQDLKRFADSLRARRSSRQEALLEQIDLEALLHALPLWVGSFADVHRAIPFRTGIFDLVIVDEATQCDMATCLPVIERGKRLVVTGDPRQLRHVSFLRRSHQEILLERHGLPSDLPSFDYRDKSLLDLVNDRIERQDQTAFLDEHFRSHPELIAFSNGSFYDGALRIMTERPVVSSERRLLIRKVNGRRESAGYNEGEAEALLEDLESWVEKEEGLPEEQCHGIGVLSPFRDQVDLLQRGITERLSLSAIERHRIRVETAYGFQGEERDLMFLSFALDPTSPAAAFRYLERSDVFNVAVTRARARQYVYCSVLPSEAAKAPLLRLYLERAMMGTKASRRDERPVDPFMKEVEEALIGRGCLVWPAFPVAGDTVDLLAVRDGATLAVDLIGYPGDFVEAFEIERCRISQRAGLRVFPLPWSAWKKDSVACLAALDEWLER